MEKEQRLSQVIHFMKELHTFQMDKQEEIVKIKEVLKQWIEEPFSFKKRVVIPGTGRVLVMKTEKYNTNVFEAKLISESSY